MILAGEKTEENVKAVAPTPPPLAPPGPPVYHLIEWERENLKELSDELQQLYATNVALDLQKARVLQTIGNNQLEQKRLLDKVQRRLGLPDGLNVDVDPEKGTLTPVIGMRRMG